MIETFSVQLGKIWNAKQNEAANFFDLKFKT